MNPAAKVTLVTREDG